MKHRYHKKKKRKGFGIFIKVIILIFSFIVIQEFEFDEAEKYHEQIDNDSLPWNLTLVNKWNPVPEDYKLKLMEVEGGEKVDERIYSALVEMLDAAEMMGYEPVVVSGYRTQADQEQLYHEKYNAYIAEGYSKMQAKELTDQWVAEPGTSEHQIGLAVDVNGNSYDIYIWLEENCYQYGFIRRYAGEKENITGIMDEPWHFRYVGHEAAEEIYKGDLCLEEYLILEK